MTADPPPSGGLVRRYLPVVVVAGLIAAVPPIARAVRGNAGPEGTVSTVNLPITPARAAAEHRHVDFGPNCDLATGRIRMPTVYAPPCVPPFRGDNGGATTQGVTRTTITIAVYEGAPSLLEQSVLATGGSGDTAEQTRKTLQDYVTMFEQHVETYGRRIKLVPVEASGGGDDDAAAKADAIRVATEIKAFASFGGPDQTGAYAQELAARHVLCIGCATGATDAVVRSEAPYVWDFQPSPEQADLLTAEYVGKRLKGGAAEGAGEASLRSRTRVFGVLAYDTPSGAFIPARQDLLRDLASYGVSIAATGSYTLDLTRAQELARTLITKMKGAGVTSVILDTDPFAPIFLVQEATSEGYFPEWIVTGSKLTDTSAFSRYYDQRQWAHAFGISELSGRVNEADSDPFHLYQWQFGAPPPASSTYPLIYAVPFLFFLGEHLAGPDLTPASFQQGMFSYPVTGGGPTVATLSFGRHGIWPNDDYLGFDDATEIWWDPLARGQDEIGRNGAGLYRYVDGGRRYRVGTFPSTPAHPFQPAGTVTIFDPVPATDRAPAYPSPAAGAG
jgi:hypothetical protein